MKRTALLNKDEKEYGLTVIELRMIIITIAIVIILGLRTVVL